MSRRVLQLRKLLDNAVTVEAQWDPLLGGRETRAYRDLLAYTAAKLVLAGSSPESVISYLSDLLTDHGAELVDLRDALLSSQEDAAGDGEKSGSA